MLAVHALLDSVYHATARRQHDMSYAVLVGQHSTSMHSASSGRAVLGWHHDSHDSHAVSTHSTSCGHVMSW